MSIAMVLKIFSDCCVCFAILASGPIMFELPLLIPALLCGVSAGLAAFFGQKGWKTARRLCALLPMLCLVLAGDLQQGMILAVPALYTALMIFRGKLELEYYTYRRFFLQSLALLSGAYVFVSVWAFLANVTSEAQPIPNAEVIFRYGLVHVLCGIVLQRQLRLGVERSAEGGKSQLSMVLMAGGSILFAFFAAEPLLREVAMELVMGVLSVIGIPVVILGDLIGKLLKLWKKNHPEDPTEGATVDVSGNDAISFPDLGSEEVTNNVPKIQLDPAIAWGILVVILLVIAVVILCRSFRKGRGAVDSGKKEGQVIEAPKRKKDPRLSNRGKVRQMYRTFLRLEKGRGMKLKISDTSADILRRIHPETDRPSANELRQVYLAARYDDRQSISRSQVNEAKRALKGTQRTKK